MAKFALGNKTTKFGIYCELLTKKFIYKKNSFFLVSKCNFFKRNHWTLEENEDKNQWFVRKWAVLMGYMVISNLLISLVPEKGLKRSIYNIWLMQITVWQGPTNLKTWWQILPQFIPKIKNLNQLKSSLPDPNMNFSKSCFFLVN